MVLAVDPAMRNPRWVVEHVTKESLSAKSGTRESSVFYEDPELPARFRAKLNDYRGSGFDRGHMAPASNHKTSQDAMNDTFTLSNMCPQVGEGFNRDYWARFERFARDATNEYDDVWIVTGPLYLPQPAASGWVMNHRMLGSPPELVGVPTHFFKVVLGEKKGGALGGSPDHALAAFVMPNAVIKPQHPLAAFTVPLTALEAASGIQFFPKLIDDATRQSVDAAALQWQRKGALEAGKAVRAIAGGQPPLLLPAPEPAPAKRGGRGREAEQQAAAAAAAAQNTANALVAHLCDKVTCSLPAEEFWKKK